MPYALMHVTFLSPNSLEMRVFRVGFNNLIYIISIYFEHIYGKILAASLKDRFSFSHFCTTVSAFLIFFPKVLFMVPWEIQRWNSTAAWRCALAVRMLSTATVEGKQLFPRVRLHAFEVGRIHDWDD